ncbi:hypothetical protein CDD83_8820 [Cordyceps sp. RAO-2017]|nr:hypothetical protein CDD83_8820 [Cordyceps sp. RAO-2017]
MTGSLVTCADESGHGRPDRNSRPSLEQGAAWQRHGSVEGGSVAHDAYVCTAWMGSRQAREAIPWVQCQCVLPTHASPPPSPPAPAPAPAPPRPARLDEGPCLAVPGSSGTAKRRTGRAAAGRYAAEPPRRERERGLDRAAWRASMGGRRRVNHRWKRRGAQSCLWRGHAEKEDNVPSATEEGRQRERERERERVSLIVGFRRQPQALAHVDGPRPEGGGEKHSQSAGNNMSAQARPGAGAGGRPFRLSSRLSSAHHNEAAGGDEKEKKEKK